MSHPTVVRARAKRAVTDIDWRWLIVRAVPCVLAGYVVYRWSAMVLFTDQVRSLWLRDHDLYMDATRRWLAGGPFYPLWQTSGPYEFQWGMILYPPVALVLFVPFSFLPGWLWLIIPPVVTVAVIASYRPGTWRLAIIAALLCIHPEDVLCYPAGTPTTWVVMFIALATRWPWWSALILAKPSLFLFGLVGLRSRNWWLAVFAMAAVSLVTWQMTLVWIRVVLDLHGADLLYSLPNVPFMVVPFVAAYPALRQRGNVVRATDPPRTNGAVELAPNGRPAGG